MGYMGLDRVTQSDAASDLAYDMQKAMAKELKKGLKDRGNCCNTDGPTNVALIFEEMILPRRDSYIDCEELVDVAKETYDMLGKTIEEVKGADWDGDKENMKFHLNAFKRLQKSVKKFIDSV